MHTHRSGEELATYYYPVHLWKINAPTLYKRMSSWDTKNFSICKEHDPQYRSQNIDSQRNWNSIVVAKGELVSSCSSPLKSKRNMYDSKTNFRTKRHWVSGLRAAPTSFNCYRRPRALNLQTASDHVTAAYLKLGW